MKKIRRLLMSVLLLGCLAMFAACGNDNNGTVNNADETKNKTADEKNMDDTAADEIPDDNGSVDNDMLGQKQKMEQMKATMMLWMETKITQIQSQTITIMMERFPVSLEMQPEI